VKRLAFILVLLFGLPACFGREDDQALRELTQKQVRVVQTELDGIDRSRQNLDTQLALLQSRLNDMDDELHRVDARLVATRASNNYLLELHTIGFGPSAGHWVLENPAWPTNVLLLFALAVVLCWVLYRLRLRNDAAADLAEVNRVIARIESAPANFPALRPAASAPAPRPVAPAPAQADPPAKKSKVSAPAPAAPMGRAPVSVPVPDPPAAPVKPAPIKPAAGKPPAEKAARPAEKPAAAADKFESKRAVSRREVRRKAAARPVAKKCKVEGCPNKHRSKGYCNKHYQQWRRGGTVEGEQEE